MRNALSGMREWIKRKRRPKITRARPTPVQYTIFFNVGGKRYYMVWDAWVLTDDGTWELLSAEQMARAVEYWLQDNAAYAHVARSGGNVSVIRTPAIDEFEVIDNTTFQQDV